MRKSRQGSSRLSTRVRSSEAATSAAKATATPYATAAVCPRGRAGARGRSRSPGIALIAGTRQGKGRQPQLADAHVYVRLRRGGHASPVQGMRAHPDALYCTQLRLAQLWLAQLWLAQLWLAQLRLAQLWVLQAADAQD